MLTRNHGHGCPYCSGRLPTKENNLFIINPILSKEWNYKKNDKNPEDYTPNSGKSVWWKCKDCGYEWKAIIGDRNRGIGCPECAESHGEKIITEWLKLNNIDYIPQKTFEGLTGVSGGLLSYDFYLQDYNYLIEYQGQYHDGTVPNQTKEDFEKQQEHDRRKKEYTLSNKYNFLEIWYWDFDNIEEILTKELLN